MAEFLITADISARLQKIIREADERLVLISPYLKLNPRIRELLEQKSRTKTHVRIIYGKIGLPPEERKWIDSVPAIELCFRQSLHAKCYLNEKEAILTSMNLHQFSEQNNDEMGIVVTNNLWDEKDRELYNKISAQAEEIVLKPRKSRISVKKSAKYQGQNPKDWLASLKTSQRCSSRGNRVFQSKNPRSTKDQNPKDWLASLKTSKGRFLKIGQERPA